MGDAPGGCSEPSFWASPCVWKTKVCAFVLLVGCFVLQSALVYSDGSSAPPLSAEAQRGRRIWHRHNCNGCHQLYGFGGFLGPDLTNAWPRLTQTRLRAVLTEGTDVMPAFRLPEEEISAVGAFLRAMHETGRGQARAAPAGGSPLERFLSSAEGLAAASGNSEALAGLKLFKARACGACHVPFGVSPVGAPELATAVQRLDRDALSAVLARGRPPRMPDPRLAPEERAQMRAFLSWLNANRSRLQQGAPLVWSEVPWWEFR